jgi:uncharacterized repeat protein (TIGR03837 family)
MEWDLYCRVIDNHGDLGVCWRLARELGSRGETVRLWIDDPRALSWMAPDGAPGVRCFHWPADQDPVMEPVGDVVVEAFGCNPPDAVIEAMVQRRPAPVWLNLEYLSAESYVERSHGLPSPQGNGLSKWFFYPGFTARTGGLLRGAACGTDEDKAPGRSWLQSRGWAVGDDETAISLFCYPHAPLVAACAAWCERPTVLFATPGAAQDGLRQVRLPPRVKVIELPWLAQADYDHLLRSCDLNLVRGEDSFVSAQWAGGPFVWHIYPQHDDAHRAKLAAFLDRYLADASPSLADALRSLMFAWNGLVSPMPALPDMTIWRRHHQAWRAELRRQDDLVTQLSRFVASKKAPSC